MPDTDLTTQAALIYPAVPELDFDSLLNGLNAHLARRKAPNLVPSPMSTGQFALFGNTDLHVSVALHGTPLGRYGLESALRAPINASKEADFNALLEQGRAHIVVSVGDGPSPVNFDKPQPVPLRRKLELLHLTMRLVCKKARPLAAHFCAPNLFYTPEELDQGFTAKLAPLFVVHPVPLPAIAGPNGEDTGRGLVAWQSEHLLGRTLTIEAIPDPVPLDMSLALLDTLMRQYLKGALALNDGDALEEALGMALYIRHAPPDQDFPAGRVIVSFREEPSADGRIPRLRRFRAHPGYSAVSAPAAQTPKPKSPALAETMDLGNLEGLGTGTASRGSSAREGRSSHWMIFVIVGLFLWIGLPLLNVPKLVLESAFSEQLVQDKPAR